MNLIPFNCEIVEGACSHLILSDCWRENSMNISNQGNNNAVVNKILKVINVNEKKKKSWLFNYVFKQKE